MNHINDSNSTDNNGKEDPFNSDPTVPFINYGLLSFFIILANSLILLLIWRKRRLRTTSNMILTSLAVSDLLTGLIAVPKVYLALCIGNPLENLNKIIGKPGIKLLKDNILEVKTYIRRNKINREMMEVRIDGGRQAISRFTVQTVYDLGENQKLSLVSCEIETGRTHQIRVHAKLIECPIVGDNLYKLRRKEDVELKKTISLLMDGKRSRQMLHAHELSIVHPESSKTLFFRSNLPNDFSNLMSNLGKYKRS